MVYTATDPSGNFKGCSFSVTVTATIYPGTDGTRPSFLNWPSNIDETVPFGSSPTTVSWTEPIGVASVAASQSSGSFFVVGYTNVAYTATDASSNFESCSFSVTVTDRQHSPSHLQLPCIPDYHLDRNPSLPISWVWPPSLATSTPAPLSPPSLTPRLISSATLDNVPLKERFIQERMAPDHPSSTGQATSTRPSPSVAAQLPSAGPSPLV
ncbi:hyalin-like isoform X5 [Strongylocentrotus purpuratus]|uniref:HYR domain-containing protein n=1 Tax=Strongylocentrotus purpuratus TaxID=7668 RepID=A0A7M7PLY0_STRPU|nr:hyalin-like isoform X5 [Strongylocentrotus purpuratus]XP_030853226.1 hyalin-like isoform X5 [Strongylocentrotus purpuratus]XP_030853227.1 hyalin-like isoform X5 [Strongylocentrotus purpuratus]